PSLGHRPLAMSYITARKCVQLLAGVSFVLCYGTLLTAWNSRHSSSFDNSVTPNLTLDPQSLNSLSVDSEFGASFAERSPRSILNIGNSDEFVANNIDTAKELPKVKNKRIQGSDDSRTTELISLEDIFISVKTTKNFHDTRVAIILKTWFALAKEETYFFTDSDDPVYSRKTNGHMINTNCSSSHNRWFCHFDDDNYVNVPRLVKVLQQYDCSQDWYLGKPSIRAPLEILSRDNTQVSVHLAFLFRITSVKCEKLTSL
ncbi:fringe glycosyltransferase-like protein, partial [Dinothrombium tinctorium]